VVPATRPRLDQPGLQREPDQIGAAPVLVDFDKRSAHYEVLDRRDQPG
jgi:hypothetical protein